MIRHLRQRTPLIALAVALALAAPGRTEGVGGGDSVLKLLPADTAFYSSMLRNREQIDIVLKSKAWAKLMELPAAKFALQQIREQLANPRDPQLATALKMLEDPQNKELLEVLGDAVSDEVFIYGGSSWGDFLDLFMQVSNSVRFAPLLAELNPETRGKNPGEVQARIALHSLAANVKLIRMPDLVIGFKVKDPKKAEAQIKRLEDLIGMVIGNVPPPVRDGFKRVKVGDSSVLNLTLDGSLVPWDMLHIRDYEAKEGEFDALMKKLQGLKLSVSLGVHQGYVVLAIGGSAEDLGAIGGTGKRLTEVAELKPLAKAAGKRLTSIGYTSKALNARVATTSADLTSLAEGLGELLKAADLPAAQAENLRQDLKTLAAGASKDLPEPGAGLAFSYLTEHGSESFSYDYTKYPNGLDGSKPLTLTEHLGGNPILWYVARSKTNPETYRSFSKHAPVVFGHIEEALFTKLDDNQKEQYENVKKKVVPLLKRLDEITGTLLLPSLADGQFGLLLDAKWKSTQWHMMAPGTPQPLPLPELGILLGISDEAKFREAMKSYQALINDALAVASELSNGQIPDLKMPDPTTEKTAGGLLAYYPIPPEFGLDAQVVPTAGLSKRVLALSLSRAHTERLLKPTPLKVERGPLADLKTKKLASASGFNWPALVDAVTPWIELAVTAANPPPVPPGPDGDVMKQVRTVLEVMKVFRGSYSVTYYEDGVMITHSESILRDLE
jgi:hypothetical protein